MVANLKWIYSEINIHLLHFEWRNTERDKLIIFNSISTSPAPADPHILTCFSYCLHLFPCTLCSLVFFSSLSTAVLVPASRGAALAPFPSSPHSWQVTSRSIGLSRLAASTQMCPRSSFPVRHPVTWTSVYRLSPRGLLPLFSCKSSAVILLLLLILLFASLLIISCSFFLLLFAITFDLTHMKMLLPCQLFRLYSVLPPSQSF